MTESFSVDQIDHVELRVPDRHEAAAWFERVLGFEIDQEFEQWAADGPLMLSTGSNNGSNGPKLALFEGDPQEGKPRTGFHLVAFRVSGESFLAFLDHIQATSVLDRDGQRITPTDVVDHELAYSIYFTDPHGYRFEITTYDYEHVDQKLD